MSQEIEAYGLSVTPPRGWEARIFRRPSAGELASSDVSGASAPPGERTLPLVQVATIPIPIDAADYGSDIVDELGADDALVVLKEFDPAEASQPLFAGQQLPRALQPRDFDPATLQRRLDGQGGHQTFCTDQGRALCLYVVLGSFDRRATVVPAVNAVLGSLVVAPLVPPPAP